MELLREYMFVQDVYVLERFKELFNKKMCYIAHFFIFLLWPPTSPSITYQTYCHNKNPEPDWQE
jgi:hypothetical protein